MTDSRTNILAALSYHDYAVLIAHSDNEQYMHEMRKDHIGAFTKGNDEISKKCWQYVHYIETEAKRFAPPGQRSPRLDGFLYNPAGFVAFGNTDNVSIVAIDDFDVAPSLTVESALPISQNTLAVCPTLESMGVTNKTKSPFFDMKDLCKGYRSKSRTPRHPFVSERPLLAVTYFRTSAFASVGPGLALHHAALLAMRCCIEEAVKKLKESTDAKDPEKVNDWEISWSDVNSFKCMFLSPRGLSDIATVMLCRNYSVITAVVSALRCLRLENLYEAYTDHGKGDLRKIVDIFAVHAGAARKASEIEGSVSKTSTVPPALDKNHLYTSTVTTLGIAHDAFKAKKDAPLEESKYHGIVYANPRFAIPCGHSVNVEEEFSKPPKMRPGSDDLDADEDMRYEWCLAGANDCDLLAAAQAKYMYKYRRGIADVVQLIQGLRSGSEDVYKALPQPGRVENCSTELYILTPVLDSRSALEENAKSSVDFEGHVNARPMFYELRRQLFEEHHKKDHTFLDIPALARQLRKLRVPAPLSTRLLCLYADFAKCVGDFDHVESVLDLTDIFTTVHRVFSHELPGSLDKKLEDCPKKQRMRKEAIRLGFLGAGAYREILFLIELMEDAIKQRVEEGFQETPASSIGIDFRGGILKLVAAADVPLKCCLGILKKLRRAKRLADERKEKEKKKKKKKKDTGTVAALGPCGVYSQVAGGVKLSYYPRTVATRPRLGRKEGCYLSGIAMNIMDLFHPGRLRVSFHEVGHLILDFLRNRNRKKSGHNGCIGEDCFFCGRGDPTDRKGNETRARYEEVFAEILLCGLIFMEDSMVNEDSVAEEKSRIENNLIAYVRSFMADYSLEPTSLGRNTRDTVIRLREVLLRAFLTTDPFRELNRSDGGGKLYALDPDYELTSKDVARAKKRFREKVIDEGGPMSYEYCRLSPNVKKHILKGFEQEFREYYKHLCCMWKDAEYVFSLIHGDEEDAPDVVFGSDPSPEDRGKLLREIEKALETGTPIVRCLYEDPRRERGGADSERFGHMGILFLVRSILGKHIRALYTNDVMDPRKRVHIVSSLNARELTSQIQKEPGNKRARGNLRFINHISNGTVSFDPDMRKKLMQERIVILETFWDLSANIKARRLKRMFATAWTNLFLPDKKAKRGTSAAK